LIFFFNLDTPIKMNTHIYRLEGTPNHINNDEAGKWKYYHQLLKIQLQRMIYQDIHKDEFIKHKIQIEDITHIFIDCYIINEGLIYVGLKKSNYGSYLVWYFIPHDNDSYNDYNDSLESLLYPLIEKLQYTLMCNTIDTVIETIYPNSLVNHHTSLIKNSIMPLECNRNLLQQNIGIINRNINELTTKNDNIFNSSKIVEM